MQPMNVDFHDLVNSVADEFATETGMPVNPGARDILINRALPYQSTVEAELASGKITLQFLRRSVRTVLENAMQVAKDLNRTAVGEDTTEESIKRYCPYLFWC